MSDIPPTASRLSRLALLTFVLGLASMAGLCCVSGVPALLLGLKAVRAVNASDGRLRGSRLATAGMVLGGLGILLTLLGGGAVVMHKLQERSRRAESQNNLRVLGVALNKLAQQTDVLPPATRDPIQWPPERRISWLADLLPVLEDGRPVHVAYQKLAKKIDRTQPWDAESNSDARATTVKLFLCRDHPDYRLDSPVGVTHYVGLAGVGMHAARLERIHPLAGVFGHDRGVAFKEMERGISYTMMVAETAQENGLWLAGDFPTVRGLDKDEESYGGHDRAFGGMHDKVTLVLWADGSVRPMSDEAPALLWRRLVKLKAED